jgi:hypothetical protein
MKKLFIAMLAAGAALATTAPAMAANGELPAQEIFAAGRCIVQQDRRAAVGFLQSVPVDSETADLSLLPQNIHQRCAEGVGSAKALLIRGAIAQALFFRDFGGFGLEPSRAIPLVNLALPVQDSPEGSIRNELYRWADCIVRNDADHSERLMQSRVGSDAEATMIGLLRPYLEVCAPAGAQFSVAPAELRAVIAQSAYHSMYRYWTRQLEPVHRD